MYVIATVFCSIFHFSVSLHVPFSQPSFRTRQLFKGVCTCKNWRRYNRERASQSLPTIVRKKFEKHRLEAAEKSIAAMERQLNDFNARRADAGLPPLTEAAQRVSVGLPRTASGCVHFIWSEACQRAARWTMLVRIFSELLSAETAQLTRGSFSAVSTGRP